MDIYTSVCTVPRWGRGRGCGGGSGEDEGTGGATNDDMDLFATFGCWRAVTASPREGPFGAE